MDRFIVCAMYKNELMAFDRENCAGLVFEVMEDTLHGDFKTELIRSRGVLKAGTFVKLKEIWRNHYGIWFTVIRNDNKYFDVRTRILKPYVGDIMEHKELEHLFTYHPPKGDQGERYEKIRKAALEFAEVINILVPESADKSAAIRKIREAVMTANAAIACNE